LPGDVAAEAGVDEEIALRVLDEGRTDVEVPASKIEPRRNAYAATRLFTPVGTATSSMSSGGLASGMGTDAGSGPGSGRVGDDNVRASWTSVSLVAAHASGHFFITFSLVTG